MLSYIFQRDEGDDDDGTVDEFEPAQQFLGSDDVDEVFEQEQESQVIGRRALAQTKAGGSTIPRKMPARRGEVSDQIDEVPLHQGVDEPANVEDPSQDIAHDVQVPASWEGRRTAKGGGRQGHQRQRFPSTPSMRRSSKK